MGLRREMAIFGLALVALLSVQIAFTGAWNVISRPLWFDECVTSLLANDTSGWHELHAIAHAEPNVPGMFVMLRPLRWFGQIPPVALRLFSLGCVAAAMIGFYGWLRGGFSMTVSIAAVMLVWAQPLVMRHAFEARYYAPMLLFTVLFALALRSKSRLFLALAAVALCIIHYFGILVLCLMLVAEYVSGRSWKALIAALAGPIVLVAWAPIYFVQRKHFGAVTWVPATSARTVAEFMQELVPTSIIVLAVSITLIARLRARRTDQTCDVLPILALLAMPIVLFVLSSFVQPVMVARYSIVFAFALATAVALVLNQSSMLARVSACALCLVMSFMNLRNLSQSAAQETAALSNLASSIQTQSHNRPTVFTDGRLFFPLYYQFRLNPEPVYLNTSSADKLDEFVATVIRQVGQEYPGPREIRPRDLNESQSFLLVCSPNASVPTEVARGRSIARVNSCLYGIGATETAGAGDD